MSLVDFHGYPTVEARHTFRFELQRIAVDLENALPASKWKELVEIVRNAVKFYDGPTNAELGTMLEYCAHARGASDT